MAINGEVKIWLSKYYLHCALFKTMFKKQQSTLHKLNKPKLVFVTTVKVYVIKCHVLYKALYV